MAYYVVMTLYSYGPMYLWPYVLMAYAVMALHSYGLRGYGLLCSYGL